MGIFDSDSFWGGLSSTFSNMFGGGGGSSFGSMDQPSGMYGDTLKGGGGGFGGIMKNVGSNLAGGVGQLALGAASNALFPSKGARIVGTDVRTPEMMNAEALKAKAAGTSANALALAEQGKLDPFVEGEVRRGSRSSDAARGMLETGGSKQREDVAVQQAIQDKLKTEGSNLTSFTSGNQPMQATEMKGYESPFSKMMNMALGPGVGKSAKDLYDKWAL